MKRVPLDQEKKTIRLSSWLGVTVAVFELAMFIVSGSQAILIDGVYDAMDVVILVIYQMLLPLIYKPVSERIPFGFAQVETLFILILGLLAFGLDCVAGVFFAKILNFITGGKVNPIIGAAGISAFPMAARVCQRVAQEEDFENFLLMHAMGANAAGQVASVVAGGVVLALMGAGG